MPFPCFTLEQTEVIEQFVAQVLKRSEQIAVITGIPGSVSKALHDVTQEMRAQATRMQHKARSDETQRQAQGGLH